MIRLDPPDSLSMPVGEAMFTQRATRRLDSNRPISTEDLRTILDAASKAPSGGNTQPVRFLVLNDAKILTKFGALYYEAWWAKRFDDYGWNGPEDLPADSFYASPALLASEMKNAPVVVLAFSPDKTGVESSVFPPVQNVLLAARALGIGSVLTTLHAKVMDRVYSLLGVPAEMKFHCAMPLGYPRGAFGPTKRYPSSHTTHWNRWDGATPWS
jgi:nitroreductase